jgi:hypothetical protein
MNSNKLSYLAIAALCLLLAACSSDDAFQCVPDDAQSGAFSLQVTASGFQSDTGTRAGNNELVTTFTDGDALGLIITHPDGSIDHVRFQYNGSSWSTSDASFYDPQDTYAAYFPYQESLLGKSLDEVKAACKPLIDQSDYSGGYLPSDLLVCSSATFQTVDGKRVLPVSFTHAYALLRTPVVAPCKGSDGISGDETTYSYDASVSEQIFVIDGTPCRPWIDDDGYARLVVENKAGNCLISSQYTLKGQRLTSDVTIDTPASGQCYTVKYPVFDIGVYGLDKAQVGDFYCKNSSGKGYLIPGDALLTAAQQAACIGIVYSTDASRIGKAATDALASKGVTPHGLVMALTNASDGCRWGEYGKDENSSGGTGEPFKENTDQLQKQYSNIDGYGETHWIIDTYNSGTTLQDTYSAFYHASRYGTADSNTDKYATPSNTTGWFIPSMGQWWDILSNLGGIDLSSYQNKTDGYTNISGAAPTAVNNMNQYLEKINGAMKFTDTYFWSSSEYSSYHACTVDFNSSGHLNLSCVNKGGSFRLRCSFAF